MILNWLISFSTIHDILVYGLIAVVSFVEGPILAFVCGLLLHFNLIDLIPAYLALMIGDLLGDTFWYWIGRRFGLPFIRRFGHFFRVSEKDVLSVEKIFHAHKDTILIVSKVTMGFGFALVTLITAGLVRIPFNRYIIMNAAGQFVWTGALLSLGYLFSQLYVTFDNIFARISTIAIGVFLLIVIIRYASFIKQKISARLSA